MFPRKKLQKCLNNSMQIQIQNVLSAVGYFVLCVKVEFFLLSNHAKLICSARA